MAEQQHGRRVLAAGVLAVVVAVVVVGGVAAYVAAQSVQDRSRAELAATSTGLALDLQGVLTQDLVTSGAVASSSTVIAAAEAAQAGDASGPAVEAARRELDRIERDTDDPLDAIVLIGADGVCITATDANIVGKDLSGRKYVQTVLSTGSATVGEVITSLATGDKVVIAASPVYSADGSSVIGVLSAGSNLDKLLQPLAAVAVGSGGYAYVVDASGLYLRHPDAGAIMTAALADVAGMEGVAQAVQERREATVSYTRDGTDMVAAVRPVPVAGWAVVAMQEAADLYAPSATARSTIVVVAVIVAAVGALVLFAVGRRSV